MKNKTSYGILLGIAAVVIGGPLLYYGYYIQTPGNLDAFASCLEEKGATFYGAFWCPHCQAQKAEFGKSKDKLPYVECSNPDGKTQTQVCIDKEIKSYPTWEFADGTRVTGEQSLATLAEKTGCPLPQ